jgi:GNAT superfamily N-acetyltransferase
MSCTPSVLRYASHASIAAPRSPVLVPNWSALSALSRWAWGGRCRKEEVAVEVDQLLIGHRRHRPSRADGADPAVCEPNVNAVALGRLEGRLVGCAYVRQLDATTADLGLISTATDYWRSGIGGELVRSAEELMRSRGVTTMQLELLVPKRCVHPEKDKLRAWYIRLGYQVVRSAPFEEIAAHLAPQLAVPCETLIFHKSLTEAPGPSPP